MLTLPAVTESKSKSKTLDSAPAGSQLSAGQTGKLKSGSSERKLMTEGQRMAAKRRAGKMTRRKIESISDPPRRYLRVSNMDLYERRYD